MITGIIGKPNVGKSTFFNSATLMNVAVANYPFTTISPNIGTAYIRVKCVHEELGVKDNPISSTCIDGTRLIPVKLVDVAGLVPGAAKGRGLGNKFLDDLRQADALIHVIDASGGTDEEGHQIDVGTRDPVSDLSFVREEIVLWIESLIDKDWPRISRTAESGALNVQTVPVALAEKLSGLSISENTIEDTVRKLELKVDKPTAWTNDDLHAFASEILASSKPILIAANKCDQPAAREIIQRLSSKLGEDQLIIPCAAEAELVLRRASKAGLITYLPGDEAFMISDPSKISPPQKKVLDLVNSQVMDIWHGTGVQKAINDAYLSLLEGIVVYPVEDETKYADKKGNVLPDARIMRRGQTARDLAFKIHTDLGKTFLYAIDAKTGLRHGADYELNNNDVLKIVATAKKS
ncbi:MAG: redox-regulated ATPase YchF [Nitrososphaerales archaeon]